MVKRKTWFHIYFALFAFAIWMHFFSGREQERQIVETHWVIYVGMEKCSVVSPKQPRINNDLHTNRTIKFLNSIFSSFCLCAPAKVHIQNLKQSVFCWIAEELHQHKTTFGFTNFRMNKFLSCWKVFFLEICLFLHYLILRLFPMSERFRETNIFEWASKTLFMNFPLQLLFAFEFGSK